MMHINRQRFKLAAADLLSAAVGFLIFDIVRFYTLPSHMHSALLVDFLCLKPIVAEQIVVPFITVGLFALFGSYNKANTLYKSRLEETLVTAVVAFVTMLIVFFAALVNDSIPERITNYELMLALFSSLFIPAFIVRMSILNSNARRVRRGDYAIDTVVVGASPENAARLRRIRQSAAPLGLDINACVDVDGSIDGDVFEGLPVHHGDDVCDLCRGADIQAVLIMPSQKGAARTAKIIEKLYSLHKPLFLSPELPGTMGLRPRISSVTGEPVVDITNARISPAALNFKRLGDIVVSALSLLILSPLMLGIAIAVKFDSRGPVIYRQCRIGRHKEPFMINKFRTMRVDAESSGPSLATVDDPRVTRIGHFLRKYRLDELPQFWNVLIGEMSLVGPRPEREHYISRIIERCPAYTLVHQVRPGITSWGMVKYGYASNIDQMIERLDYDLLYLDNVSLAVDLKILFHTVNTVLNGRGQ